MATEDEQELLRRFIDALDAHRRHLEEAQRASWGDVEESNFIASATSLILKAQSENEERIDFIIAYVGLAAGKGGLIQLGDADRPNTIPVLPGIVLAMDVRIRLKNTSTRRLDTTTFTNNSPTFPPDNTGTGFLYLGLFGSEIPIGARRW